MKIINFGQQEQGKRTRVSATVIWENRDRSPQNVYIETTKEFASDLTCNPHAFLVACVLPAMYYQEKRIALNREICPELRQGLITAMNWLRHWFNYGEQIIPIEAPVKSRQPRWNGVPRTGAFFTGGVDSWANLRINRLNYPLQHPGSIKDCLVVYGMQKINLDDFEQAVNSFTKLAKQAQINIIPVYTNIYSHLMDLDQDYRFWMDVFNGAALAAIAHAFTRRFTNISIASGNNIPNLVPLGTHPLLDPNYSSYDLKIKHDGITYSRLVKTKLVAEWDLALQNLRVCDMYDIPLGRLNCGRCEKCIRTTTTLLAIGALAKTAVFPYQDVSPDLLAQGIYIKHEGIETIYRELIPLLEQQNRHDLVKIIQRQLLIAKIRRFDHQLLGGNIFQFARILRNLVRGQIESSWQKDVTEASEKTRSVHGKEMIRERMGLYISDTKSS